MWVCFARGGCVSRAARRAVQRAYGHVREISFKPSLACRKTKRLLKARLIVRTFTTTLWSHAQVAAAFSRMLPDAPECFPSWYQYLWPQDGHLSFWPSGLLGSWIQNGLDRDRRRGCSRSTSYKLSRGIPQCTRLRFAAEMLRRGPGARLELLTRISSIRFCFLFCTSGRMNDRRDSGN